MNPTLLSRGVKEEGNPPGWLVQAAVLVRSRSAGLDSTSCERVMVVGR